MLGAFYCPHCKEPNACACETCKPYIKEGEYVCKWNDDGNSFTCSKCGKYFTPGDALDTEYELTKTPEDAK